MYVLPFAINWNICVFFHNNSIANITTFVNEQNTKL